MRKPSLPKNMTARTIVQTHALGIHTVDSTKRAATATKAKLAPTIIKIGEHHKAAVHTANARQQHRMTERELAIKEAELEMLRRNLAKATVIDVDPS